MRRGILSIRRAFVRLAFSGGMLLLVAFPFFALHAQAILSPDGYLQAELGLAADGGGRPQLTIIKATASSRDTVASVWLGLELQGGDLAHGMHIVSRAPQRQLLEKYEMLSGKRRLCENAGTEQTFVLQNGKGQRLGISICIFNDGLAFRYAPQLGLADTLLQEHSSYVLAAADKKWMQRYTNDYEGFFDPVQANPEGAWSYPLLIERSRSLYVLLSEANILRGHAASHLSNRGHRDRYQVTLGQDRLPIAADWQSPWRSLIIGSLADIIESTLITDLSAPSKLHDTEWIVPGNVAWIYWAYNHSSSDFQKVNEYSDLAASMHWRYSLIDWKWDAMSNGGNVLDAIRYANARGVKPLLWYNSGTGWIGEGAPGPLDRLLTADKRKQEYAWLHENGVAGVKIDFFKGDDAAMMGYYIDLLEDAAAARLMVNFHGSTAPRGWSRTYPNLLTMEAVYGAEWYNNNDTLTLKAARHNSTLPFTRNVIGPMDYTPGTFSDSQHRHVTSHAHELALMIAFESGWQHRPDRPASYWALPAEVQQLLATAPAAWDDTKLLSGYPGEDIVIARRKGNRWYVAGLNGSDAAKTLLLDPKALGAPVSKCLLFRDGKAADRFLIEERGAKAVKIRCLPRGGFVAVLELG